MDIVLHLFGAGRLSDLGYLRLIPTPYESDRYLKCIRLHNFVILLNA